MSSDKPDALLTAAINASAIQSATFSMSATDAVSPSFQSKPAACAR